MPLATANAGRAGRPIESKEAAVIAIGNIVELAGVIAALACTMVEKGEDSFDINDPLAVRYLAGQIGWLADLSAKRLGDEQLVGDAEQWMMGPSYHAAVKEACHG